MIRLDQHAWSECYVTAFAFFGGVPARLVPNMFRGTYSGFCVLRYVAEAMRLALAAGVRAGLVPARFT